MAIELIAVGTTLLNSGDLVATAGTQISLKNASGRTIAYDVAVAVLAKTTIGYQQIAVLTGDAPTYVFNSPITYQVERPPGASVGVDAIGAAPASVALGNADAAALITAAGTTTTQTSADQTNSSGRGVIVVLNMSVIGIGSVTLAIQGKDAASGQYYPLLTGAAVVANSVNVYNVYPGLVAAANAAANSQLPHTWRVVVTANNANPVTYTVGAAVGA